MKRYGLTQEQFDSLSVSGWEIKELHKEDWGKIPNLPRINDAIKIYYSGCYNAPKILNGVLSVAGYDVVALEGRPQKDEPELNAYHGVIEQLDPTKNPYPYLMYAPFAEEALFGHWGGFDMLDKYAAKIEIQDFVFVAPDSAASESANQDKNNLDCVEKTQSSQSPPE